MNRFILFLKRLASLLKATPPVEWLLLSLFLLAGVIFVLSPIWATNWARRPFPGFVIEQTLVVSDYNGVNWSGRSEGMAYPQRVISLNGKPVATPAEFQAMFETSSLGDNMEVATVSPNGESGKYPGVRLHPFPVADLIRLFWLPYVTGLAFLSLGAWVYTQRGKAYPGRAFALFCICAALVNGLMFDLITTHNAPALWTAAIAFQGGALFRLGLVFPEDKSPHKSRDWYFYTPLLISLALAVWGLMVINDNHRPWDYVLAWRFSYLLTGFSIVFFLGMMIFRMKTVHTPLAQQQIRIILWGSLLAFIPISVWMFAPLFGVLLPWNPILFLPLLLFFPLSIGIAVARYRLWDIDVLINRTLVYGVLTFLLGAIYFGIVIILQSGFEYITRAESPYIAVVSTLAIALLFNPLRKRIQTWIDQRFFRKKYHALRAIESFADTLRHEADLDHLTYSLLTVVKDTVSPQFAELCSCVGTGEDADISLTNDDPLVDVLHRSRDGVELDHLNIESASLDGLRRKGIVLVMPVISQGELVGMINLGPHTGELPYSLDDRRLLSALAGRVAPAMRIVQMIRQERLNALMDQQYLNELRVARLIQHTLLPQEMPELPGWYITGHYQPAREVGGDFYDVIELNDGRLGVVIGDATGKGVPAAMVMAAARGVVRAMALQMASPGTVLRRANELLLPTMPPNMFVTCLYAVINPRDGSVTFANAGHNLPCLTGEARVLEMDARGMPLGLMPDMVYEERCATIEPGEWVLFYSDGLVEAHNASREMFGVPRLREVLLKPPADSDLIHMVLGAWHAFLADRSDQEDDMTLIVLQRAGGLIPQPVQVLSQSNVAVLEQTGMD